MTCIDDGGNLANWIVGGLIGGLVGGVVSAAQGGSFWEGAVQGAVSGAIAGAAVDVALATVATCGLAGIAVGGAIAFFGGAGGSLAGEELLSLLSTGHLKDVDSKMKSRAIVAGAFNVLAFGFSSVLKYADEGIQGFNQSPKAVDVLKTAGENLTYFSVKAIDVTSAFGAAHISLFAAVLTVS